jgi:hypothetical protein
MHRIAASALEPLDQLGSRVSGKEKTRAGLVARLRARRSEIEEAIFARLRSAVPDPIGDKDPDYVAGLRMAVAAIVDYVLIDMEQADGLSRPTPSAAVAQVRRSARCGVSLDTVLRRYTLGHMVFEGFVIEEAEHGDLSAQGPALRSVLGAEASSIDRLMAAIANEYSCELQRAERSSEQRRSECVQRLLVGAPVDVAAFDYAFDTEHLGVIARGARAEDALGHLAAGLDRQLLIVPRGEGILWAWLGGHRRLAITDIKRTLSEPGLAGVSLAIGEPAQGVHGWRLTHQQAQAASRVMLRRPQGLTRFADVALLASVLGDEALARSLEEIYLAPLGSQRDGGAALRQTLRAYFAAGHNVKATAARLGVDRGTVRKRLYAVEQRVGRLLQTCQPELEVALRLEELQEIPRGASDAQPARELH